MASGAKLRNHTQLGLKNHIPGQRASTCDDHPIDTPFAQATPGLGEPVQILVAEKRKTSWVEAAGFGPFRCDPIFSRELECATCRLFEAGGEHDERAFLRGIENHQMVGSDILAPLYRRERPDNDLSWTKHGEPPKNVLMTYEGVATTCFQTEGVRAQPSRDIIGAIRLL
jgi:hypothetical protein